MCSLKRNNNRIVLNLIHSHPDTNHIDDTDIVSIKVSKEFQIDKCVICVNCVIINSLIK